MRRCGRRAGRSRSAQSPSASFSGGVAGGQLGQHLVVGDELGVVVGRWRGRVTRAGTERRRRVRILGRARFAVARRRDGCGVLARIGRGGLLDLRRLHPQHPPPHHAKKDGEEGPLQPVPDVERAAHRRSGTLPLPDGEPAAGDHRAEREHVPHDPPWGEDQPAHANQITRRVASAAVARSTAVRDWLTPQPPGTAPLTDPRTRRLVGLEVLVVLTVTLGLSAVRSGLSLLNAVMQPVPLNEQQVALNAPAADVGLIDFALQLTRVLQLVGWGALGAYLLLRAGFAMRDIGLDRRRPGRDALGSAGLAALIGVPGLGLYLVARAIGVSVTIAPTTLDDTWWRVPVLLASAAANSWAEEGVMVAYLITRLRQLGWSENRSLLVQAVLRGCYHLYQGLGGLVGNIVMGLVFGRVWQRTNRLWMLVGAHALIDVVAFVGYAALSGRVG